MKTKKILQLLDKPRCKKCGKPIYSFNLGSSEVCNDMAENGICWECAYFDRFLISIPRNLEIVGNKCFVIYPYQTPKPGLILGGNKTRYFLRTDGSCLKTNDYWIINEIPFKYQQVLQPTGWWVSKTFYERIKRSDHACRALGCMDRYHCYRFKISDEEPYNNVPSDWIVGDEKCPAYLSILEIEGYDQALDLNN